MLLGTPFVLAIGALGTFVSATTQVSAEYPNTGVDARALHAHGPHKPICVDGVHMIAVSGIGSPIRHSYGLLTSTVRSIRDAIPHSGNYSLSYPKKSTDYMKSTGFGQHLLIENIKWYTKHCPHTPVVLLGYSAGAIITSNAICGKSDGELPARLPLKYRKHIIAVVTMGDETFVPDLPWDRGTCKEGQGVVARWNSHHCKPWASKYLTFCDSGDTECCAGGGAYNNAHHGYAIKYDQYVTEYVVKKFEARMHSLRHHHG